MKYIPDYERDQVADAIRHAKRESKKEVVGFAQIYTEAVKNRSAKQYIDMLRGVKNFFDYIKRLNQKVVLDVGAGSSRGIAELAKSKFGEDLEFKASDIIRHENIDKNIGNSNFSLTPVETLKKHADESVGAVTSVIGALSYTQSVPLTVESIDRVLISNGVCKATLLGWKEDKEGIARLGDFGFRKRFIDLVEWFKERGYDVATHKFESGDDFPEPLITIVAIKPPHDIVSAEELLQSDLENLDSQL